MRPEAFGLLNIRPAGLVPMHNQNSLEERSVLCKIKNIQDMKVTLD